MPRRAQRRLTAFHCSCVATRWPLANPTPRRYSEISVGWSNDGATPGIAIEARTSAVCRIPGTGTTCASLTKRPNTCDASSLKSSHASASRPAVNTIEGRIWCSGVADGTGADCVQFTPSVDVAMRMRAAPSGLHWPFERRPRSAQAT